MLAVVVHDTLRKLWKAHPCILKDVELSSIKQMFRRVVEAFVENDAQLHALCIFLNEKKLFTRRLRLNRDILIGLKSIKVYSHSTIIVDLKILQPGQMT